MQLKEHLITASVPGLGLGGVLEVDSSNEGLYTLIKAALDGHQHEQERLRYVGPARKGWALLWVSIGKTKSIY